MKNSVAIFSKSVFLIALPKVFVSGALIVVC